MVVGVEDAGDAVDGALADFDALEELDFESEVVGDGEGDESLDLVAVDLGTGFVEADVLEGGVLGELLRGAVGEHGMND